MTSLTNENSVISIEPTWPIKYSVELAILAERNEFSNIGFQTEDHLLLQTISIVTLAAVASSTFKNKIWQRHPKFLHAKSGMDSIKTF